MCNTFNAQQTLNSKKQTKNIFDLIYNFLRFCIIIIHASIPREIKKLKFSSFWFLKNYAKEVNFVNCDDTLMSVVKD